MTFEHSVTILCTCPRCHKVHEVEVDFEDYTNYMMGDANIQDAFPYLSANEREYILTSAKIVGTTSLQTRMKKRRKMMKIISVTKLMKQDSTPTQGAMTSIVNRSLCRRKNFFAQGIDNHHKVWYNKCVIKERK